MSFPQGPNLRVDTWVSTGTEISAFYDSLIAKVMVWAPSRDEAISAMEAALSQISVKGITTNLEFLQEIVKSKQYK